MYIFLFYYSLKVKIFSLQLLIIVNDIQIIWLRVLLLITETFSVKEVVSW